MRFGASRLLRGFVLGGASLLAVLVVLSTEASALQKKFTGSQPVTLKGMKRPRNTTGTGNTKSLMPKLGGTKQPAAKGNNTGGALATAAGGTTAGGGGGIRSVWSSSYQTAKATAARQKKPLIVIVLDLAAASKQDASAEKKLDRTGGGGPSSAGPEDTAKLEKQLAALQAKQKSTRERSRKEKDKKKKARLNEAGKKLRTEVREMQRKVRDAKRKSSKTKGGSKQADLRNKRSHGIQASLVLDVLASQAAAEALGGCVGCYVNVSVPGNKAIADQLEVTNLPTYLFFAPDGRTFRKLAEGDVFRPDFIISSINELKAATGARATNEPGFGGM